MNTLQTQNNICEAIDIIVQQAINNAGFDRTIQATIINCTDESVGQYKVRYQDSTFYAYAQSAEDKYSAGTGVYILIQNNDMARDKFIIGTVDKLGKDYISIIDESDRYEKIGTSCITLSDDIQLCSYKKNDIKSITDIETIDNEALLTYSQEAEFLAIKMNVQTALDRVQRRQGNYGLKLELLFKDAVNNNAELITKTYIINIDSMVGQPYLYVDKTAQFFTIAVDPEIFAGIKSITAFCEKFPNEAENMPDDIFFSDLEIYAAIRLDETEISASRITFLSPQGFIFSSTIPILNIQAVIRVSNEVKNTGVDYYWFVEDPTVTTDSTFYSVYGGQGWKCLNFYDIIELEDGSKISEWKSDINIKSFKIENNQAKEVQYKCIAKMNEEILSKEFTLYNSLAKYEIFVASDSGTIFYNGLGSPTLSCVVKKDGNVVSANFQYVWTKTDNNNLSVILSEQSDICQISISSIDEFVTYKCAVYNEEGIFIGANKITILNKKGTEGTYNLVINNGTQTFIYNEDGVSPASSNIVNPITILPLSFTLFDNNGQSFDEDTLTTLDFSWKVPAENTLLQAVGGELIDGYYYFRGADYLQLNYKIASVYSINKTNNQIELNLTYKNLRLKAITNFIFIKEGEIGTNGTGVVAAIQAIGLKDGEEPMTYRFASTTNKNYSSLHFNLFSNEDEGTWLSVSEKSTNSNMTWSILRNKYSTNLDLTNLTYTENSGFAQPQYNTSGYPANVIAVEAKYNNKKYFTTLPMITGIINSNSYPYILYLKRGTGFRTVMYAADGTKPKYNTAEPFEVGLRKTDGTEIDISGSEYTLTWAIKGTDDGNSLATYLTKINTELNKNQFKCRPSEKYDGRSVSIALECIAHRNGSIISRIYIPIYFYLNTYGYDELNDWNGNSIEIDDNGGYILTPQIGAGEKNSDNTFTGLLMGKVKLSSESNSKIGLIGLYNGIQTIFLDSQTGRAEFGKTGAGQIILDPSTNEAIIQSGNYKVGESGMQINLTTPTITFGSGRFNVDSNGILTATDVNLTGTITAEEGFLGGWSISESGITYDSTDYTVHVLTGTNTNKDFLVVYDKTTSTWPFFVRADGYMRAANASIIGSVTATTGTIGGITLNSDYGLYVNGKTSSTSTASGFLIQKNGNIYLGPYSNGHCPIELSASGNLYAINGTIGCWTMNNQRMYSAKAGVNKDENAGMAFWAGNSSDYTGRNASFRVTHEGALYADNVNLQGALTADFLKLTTDIGVGGLWGDGGLTIFDQYTSEGGYGAAFQVICPSSKDSDYIETYCSTTSMGLNMGAYYYNPADASTSGILDDTYFSIDFQTDYTDSVLTGTVSFQGYMNANCNLYYEMFNINFSESRGNALLQSPIIYNETTDAGSNVRISTNGYLMRYKASSSQRYKHNIQNLNLNEIYGLYNVPVRTFIYNLDYLNKDSERYGKTIPGLIAEEVAAVNDILVDHLEDGRVEMWNNNILVPCMLKLIQHNHEEINELKQQVKQLQAKLDNI